MARNFQAGNGTLAGSPVALVGPSGCKVWAIFNDHASNVYDFAALGETVKVNAGECVVLPVETNSATIDGTGAYRFIAFDDAGAATAYLRSIAAVLTANIADASVTSAKLAAAVAGDGLAGGAGAALSVNVDASTIEINADTLRCKDGGITAAKLAASSVTGAKVAALANDGTAPQVEVLVATGLANATGNEDITLALPDATTWCVVDARVEQAGVGDAGNSYLLSKNGAAISASIAGSATDGAILAAMAIPAANKANNSFANGNVLRWAVVAAGGTAAGVGYVRLRRLT